MIGWELLAVVSVLFAIFIYRYIEIKKYNKKINNDMKIIDKYVLLSYSDTKGRITYVSEALCELNGYTKEELIGRPYNIFRHPDSEEELFRDLWKTIQSGKNWRGEVKNIRKDSSTYWVDLFISPNFDDSGIIEGYTALRYDITDKKRIEELSVTDQLTKLSNRLFLDKSYDAELKRALRYNSKFSVIILDVDNFKNVNDTFGHDVGDKVLVEMANILASSVRNTDSLGRWGGEEFMIICYEAELKQCVELANKIRIKIQESEFNSVGKMTCSFGVSQFQADDKSKEVIKRADIALYKAKNRGKNCVVFE
ncbi:sensor domain-containing diguanylate cyclase [Candidatus Sulfurimonas baltica]|uniref:GGDEF domain-containing protein n=1 Tax=Candidatus Sulfurimonas baltica TaxID=2740404 RepID=A0A7S7LUD2_9BACT|nr:sensor domain-containing diguanylate cyclase [Candidatus Sulfurimonas baltica]QOY51548.1 GGDEF domain-containing protein [Candidatus Sulfurimonas baltica]